MTADIQDLIATRGITEILHFTTNNGLLGILASGRVLSRHRLNENDLVSAVRLPVWAVRKDPNWTDYVNLSIDEVSRRMLATSEEQHRNNPDVWWTVLSFAPEILTHEGVWFTTTNNTYNSTVRRGEGLAGLEDLYAEPIPWGWYGAQSWRSSNTPNNRPTDAQAEVLYPIQLPLDHLRSVSVREEEHIDEVAGWLATMTLPDFSVLHRPDVFG
ncbi:MAG: hypothetical protein JWP19_2211 [Rhodoglobus sp.]|nr:hypothetical protein [Rhodoglobus sp.]